MKRSLNIVSTTRIVTGCMGTHYQKYLFGAQFKFSTDHKALLSCLSERKNSITTQTRLIRWVDRLLPFDYEMEHIPGKNVGLVDYFSHHQLGKPQLFQNWITHLSLDKLTKIIG